MLPIRRCIDYSAGSATKTGMVRAVFFWYSALLVKGVMNMRKLLKRGIIIDCESA